MFFFFLAFFFLFNRRFRIVSFSSHSKDTSPRLSFRFVSNESAARNKSDKTFLWEKKKTVWGSAAKLFENKNQIHLTPAVHIPRNSAGRHRAKE